MHCSAREVPGVVQEDRTGLVFYWFEPDITDDPPSQPKPTGTTNTHTNHSLDYDLYDGSGPAAGRS